MISFYKDFTRKTAFDIIILSIARGGEDEQGTHGGTEKANI